MGSIVRFAAVNAKVRSLEGKLLTDEQYSKLITCKNYKDAISYLKDETFYHNVLSGYNADIIHRGDLEKILKKDYVKNFEKLGHYFNGVYKDVFKTLFMKLEVEDLKVILRGKYIKKSNDELKSLMLAEGKLNNFDYDSIINAKDIESAIQNLKDTLYYKHLAPLVSSIKDEGLFRIETSLDFIYFSFLRKCLNKIDKEDREILHKIIGTESDLLNIQWVFRGKFYYKLNPEELLNYTIYDSYKLKREELKKLSYAHDSNEFNEIIKKLPYKDVFDEDKNSEYLVERQMLLFLRNMFDGFKREGNMNISCVVAYLELQYLEIRNVISIVENIRYGIGAEESSKYITLDHLSF